jgi:putative DNA primase/helicase
VTPYPQATAASAGPIERAQLGSPTTDLSNAERFAAQHSDFLRHHHESGWYVYDKGIWQRDEALAANLAQQTVRDIYREAAAAEEASERKMLAKHAQNSESASRIQAMLQLARSHDLIRVDPKDFDADPWLLNCRNGIVDLRTGRLRKHSPVNLMTKQAPVEYVPSMTHPMWDRFLDTMLPDQGLRDFLQQAAGYSLSGDTSCEVLFFVYGPTRSGKSTFTGALKACLGDYSTTTNFETFLSSRDRDSRNSMAALWGARLVISLEVDRGRRFAGALIKAVTGMDSIKAMFKYHEEFEYRPTWKLWLVANDRPKTDSEDEALWRRMIVLPFDHSLPAGEQDPLVKETLFNDSKPDRPS